MTNQAKKKHEMMVTKYHRNILGLNRYLEVQRKKLDSQEHKIKQEVHVSTRLSKADREK